MEKQENNRIKDALSGEEYSSEDIKTSIAEPGINLIQKEPVTILSCMSDIVENTSINTGYHESKFNGKVFSVCKEQIQYVCEMVGITPNQAVLLSNIIENKGRHNFDKHDLANAMGMNYIKLLSFEKDFKALEEMKLINLTKREVVSVTKKAVESLAANERYTIVVESGLNTSQFLKEMNSIISTRECSDIDYSTMLEELDSLFENNPETDIVRQAEGLGFNTKGLSSDERTIFYVLVKRYIYNSDDQVRWEDYDDIFDDASDIGYLRSAFNRELLDLQKKKLIEPVNEDGIASMEYFHITDEVKEKIFAEVGGVRNTSRQTSLKVISPDKITEKALFYNDAEGEQVRRLAALLDRDNYTATCERLKNAGMRTGFTCIFYGGPGTGKTESVYQLARATRRGIIPVNVSEIKSCWVGESEKLVKGLFDKYKAIIKDFEIAPILLFNEADAIFGIRQEGAQRAVDKMENSLQNIILQEMEKLEGILIATTNLTQNLDKAFERRFLYKIKFNKPGIEPKARIWQSMIPDLSSSQARELAESFDFSGGQIENISRKKMIKSILDGVEPDFNEVKGYCGEELIESKDSPCRKIGY